MMMKPWLVAGLALALAQPAFAQLAPHNASGVTFGHVHLSVADPKVHHQMWVDQFGGVISTKGTFTVVKLPNMMIAFRGTKPTGGTENDSPQSFRPEGAEYGERAEEMERCGIYRRARVQGQRRLSRTRS